LAQSVCRTPEAQAFIQTAGKGRANKLEFGLLVRAVVESLSAMDLHRSDRTYVGSGSGSKIM
jgi:hypothetical protein